MGTLFERWRPGRGMTRRTNEGERAASLNPFDRQMEDFLDRYMRGFGTPWLDEARGPALDVIDRRDEVVLRADLPGLEQKDVEIEVQDNRLTLRGERAEEREEKEGDYYWSERWSGAFARSIELPPQVDPDKVDATFKKGVLEVHLPKRKEARGKKIEIRS